MPAARSPPQPGQGLDRERSVSPVLTLRPPSCRRDRWSGERGSICTRSRSRVQLLQEGKFRGAQPQSPNPSPSSWACSPCSICSPPTPPPTYRTQAPAAGVWKNGMRCRHFWERRAPQLGAGKRIPRRGVGELSEGGAGMGRRREPPSIRPRGLASGPRWRSRLPVGLLGRRPPRGRARPPAIRATAPARGGGAEPRL